MGTPNTGLIEYYRDVILTNEVHKKKQMYKRIADIQGPGTIRTYNARAKDQYRMNH